MNRKGTERSPLFKYAGSSHFYSDDALSSNIFVTAPDSTTNFEQNLNSLHYGISNQTREQDSGEDSGFNYLSNLLSENIMQNNLSNDQSSTSIEPNDEVLDYMVSIPECDNGKTGFNFRKLWAFTGPGFLMSIAYLDPGNIESDLQSGAIAGYKLLWVLLSAHVLGFFLQRLSARLGVVSGRHMAEMAYEYYPKAPRLILWIMIEIAIIGSDMQEVIGTAIAFSLLSNGWIPLFVGVLITMIDTFTFLFIDRFGFRKLEVLFAVLIGVMAVSFGYEFVITKPEGLIIVEDMFVPWCVGCGRREFLQAVSIVGAVIMPHNLYLHSALVKSRRINRSEKKAVTEANHYYFIESGIALLFSFFINLFVVAVFAQGLYGKTNSDVHRICASREGIPKLIFPNNTDPFEADIYKGGIFLGCQFGIVALYVWGSGIMAAGQSSTMTGTYAGQFVMEGFLQIRWPRWRRVLVTRAIAIVPTLFVAMMARGVENLTGMNDFLNCVQMIQLPFALLPIITFTSHKNIMFEFSSSRLFNAFALFVSIIVILINLYFSADYILGALGNAWWVILFMSALSIIYVSFVLYLIFICLQSMNLNLSSFETVYKKLEFLHVNNDNLSIKPLWQQPSIVNFTRSELNNGHGNENFAYMSSTNQLNHHSANDATYH